LTSVRGRAGRLGCPGYGGVELALRGEAESDGILGLDIGDVPVAALADRLDGRTGGSDELADLAVRKLRMVSDQPCHSVRLVLALGDRRVARPAGSNRLVGLAVHLQPVRGIGLAELDLAQRQLAGTERIAPGQLGRRRIVGDCLHLQDVEPAKFRDLLKGQRRIVHEPAGRGMRHERLSHQEVLQKR
jgi:hypothetical protein